MAAKHCNGLPAKPTGNQLNRREFLRRTGVGAAAVATFSLAQRLGAIESITKEIPRHRSLPLTGFHAYASAQSIAAGETIRFHVSSTVPYRLSVCRLGRAVDQPDADEVLHEFPESPATPQAIHCGSYVHVAKSLIGTRSAFTLECWVRPWHLDAYQGLITQHDFPSSCSFGLFIAPRGEIAFYLGDGGQYRAECLHTGGKLAVRKWHHIVGTWDGLTKTLCINGKQVGQWAFSTRFEAGAAPLRLAAYSENGMADKFLDGDLAMMAIYNRVLGEEEILMRFNNQGRQPATGSDVLACWPFREERGEHIADVSRFHRHGQIINRATWMIGGPSFDASKVSRYGDYDPSNDPKRGHGLRFASDDLYDCRWRATQEWRLPAAAKSGMYVGRVQFELNRKPMQYDVMFIVRKSARRPKAPILVLCSSNTWLAYSATPFAANSTGKQFWGTDGRPNSDPSAPAYCCYRDHHAGQPTYQIGLRLPWPAASPDVLYSDVNVGYSHLARTERFLHAWLEMNGYEFDVATDLDLHRNPAMLRGYKTLMINGHSEYWSREAYGGVDRYLRQGGTTIVLSGNTMFWRVSFDGDVMECRKFGSHIGGRTHAAIGELFHSHDGRRGSLMRECNLPAWRVIGLDCGGWAGTGAQNFGIYRANAPDHFLFQQPEPIALSKGDVFGQPPNGGLPKAVGHEWDVRLTTLRQMTKRVPSGASLPDEPKGIITLAHGVGQGDMVLDYFAAPAKTVDDTLAEMIYWERPEGGKIFNAGAIGAGWALASDPNLSALFRNVLHHFGVRRNGVQLPKLNAS